MSASTSCYSDGLSERLFCPVCFELPEEEIYQCKDGHLLCKKCFTKLLRCPQCRIPLGDKIRNRFVEEILNELRFDCQFKQIGCQTRLDRTSAKRHINTCTFNIEKFGSFISLCKLIGYECDFLVNNGNVADATRHFQTEHACHFLEVPKATPGHSKVISIPLTLLPVDQSTDKQILTPTILDLTGEGCALLLVTVFNKCDNSIAWIPLTMPYLNPEGNLPKRPALEIEFKVIDGGKGGSDGLKWNISGIDMLKAGNYFSSLIPFRIHLELLKIISESKDSKEMDVQIKCKIKKKNNARNEEEFGREIYTVFPIELNIDFKP